MRRSASIATCRPGRRQPTWPAGRTDQTADTPFGDGFLRAATIRDAYGAAVATTEDSVGFLRRTPEERRPRSGDAQLAAIAQLRRAGADPRLPHETRHFIYVPGVKAAQHLARTLKAPRRHIEIDTSARKGYWLVVVGQSMVVTPETIGALRTEFEAAAAPLGGEYDRWQVDIAGA